MTTLLRGIDFGPVWGASGVQNFFGQGYPYHRYYRHIPGFSFKGMTFVAKTTTLAQKDGFMPLDSHQMPVERRPKCIVVKFWKGVALNAVGLSGPGAKKLFYSHQWQERTEPFFISFSPLGETANEKVMQTLKFVQLFVDSWPFKTEVGLQLNLSCPNTGEDVTNINRLVEEAHLLLEVLKQLRLPVVVKLNVLMPPDSAAKIAEHSACDGICISNTIPWAALPPLGIDRRWLFGSDESPLAEFGGGGLSGAPLLPFVIEWVGEARRRTGKHINAGGGILHPRDLFLLHAAGADSVSLGVIAMLRPWRLQATIQLAHQLFS